MNVKDVKKLKFLEELIVAKGKGKLILTKPRSNRHVTVMDREDGSFDVHVTEQSTPKKYEPVFRKDKTEIINRYREIIGDEVDINNSVFDGCTLAILPTDVGKKIPRKLSPKGKNVVISNEKIEELKKELTKKYSLSNGTFPVEENLLKYLIVIWHLWPESSQPSTVLKNIFIKPKDAEKTNFTKALVINHDRKFIGTLYKNLGKYFFFSVGTFEKIIDENFECIQSKIDETLKSCLQPMLPDAEKE